MLEICKLLWIRSFSQLNLYKSKCYDEEKLCSVYVAWKTCRFSLLIDLPANINLLKSNNRNSRKTCEIYSKWTLKTPERRKWRFSGVFVVNFEHISHLFLVFILFTLSRPTFTVIEGRNVRARFLGNITKHFIKVDNKDGKSMPVGILLVPILLTWGRNLPTGLRKKSLFAVLSQMFHLKRFSKDLIPRKSIIVFSHRLCAAFSTEMVKVYHLKHWISRHTRYWLGLNLYINNKIRGNKSMRFTTSNKKRDLLHLKIFISKAAFSE